MANGSHKAGPAQADRLREEGVKRGRWLQQAIDNIPETELSPYDDSPAEITGSFQGVGAKLGLPRPARMALGIALALGLLAVLVGLGWAIAHQ